MGYLKEEQGHIPSRVVISAWIGSCRVYCRSFGITEREHGFELASKALTKAQGGLK